MCKTAFLLPWAIRDFNSSKQINTHSVELVKMVTYSVLVTVTASAVRVMVPVMVVSSVLVKIAVEVRISRVSVYETEVAVLTSIEVTVAVGIWSKEEQNAKGDESAFRPSTTSKISLH